jgi:hypothetical protein
VQRRAHTDPDSNAHADTFAVSDINADSVADAEPDRNPYARTDSDADSDS